METLLEHGWCFAETERGVGDAVEAEATAS